MQFLSPEEYTELKEVARWCDEHFHLFRRNEAPEHFPRMMQYGGSWLKGLVKAAPENMGSFSFGHLPQDLRAELLWDYEEVNQLLEAPGAMDRHDLSEISSYTDDRPITPEQWRSLEDGTCREFKVVARIQAALIYKKTKTWTKAIERVRELDSNVLNPYITSREYFDPRGCCKGADTFEEHLDKVYKYLTKKLAALHPESFGDIRSLVQSKSSKKNFRLLLTALSAYPDKEELEHRIYPYVKSILNTKWKPHHRVVDSMNVNMDVAREITLVYDISSNEMASAWAHGLLPNTMKFVRIREPDHSHYRAPSSVYSRTFDEIREGEYAELLGVDFRLMRCKSFVKWLKYAAPNLQVIAGGWYDDDDQLTLVEKDFKGKVEEREYRHNKINKLIEDNA